MVGYVEKNKCIRYTNGFEFFQELITFVLNEWDSIIIYL